MPQPNSTYYSLNCRDLDTEITATHVHQPGQPEYWVARIGEATIFLLDRSLAVKLRDALNVVLSEETK